MLLIPNDTISGDNLIQHTNWKVTHGSEEMEKPVK